MTNEKIILNPLFPFYIAETKTDDISVLRKKNVIQLVILKKGSIYFFDKIISGDSIIVLNKNNLKKITKIKNIEIFHIIFNQNFLDNIILNNYEKNIINDLKISDNGINIICHKVDKDIFITINIIYTNILKEFQNKLNNYHSIIRHKLMESFSILHRHIYESKIIISKNNTIEDIVKYINQNYSNDFSLNKLASNSGLNPSYLSRIFKEKTGKNIFEYINILRIQKSCSLLKNTDLSVLEISLMVGYKNLSFFNRYFKKVLNISPTVYRKKVK